MKCVLWLRRVLNKSKTAFTSLGMSRAPERLILALRSQWSSIQEFREPSVQPWVAWNQPPWRIYTMGMGKHYKSERVCCLGETRELVFLAHHLFWKISHSCIYLFSKYLLTKFHVQTRGQKIKMWMTRERFNSNQLMHTAAISHLKEIFSEFVTHICSQTRSSQISLRKWCITLDLVTFQDFQSTP